MANTHLTLDEHWEVFIKNQIASGRYASASELVQNGLRMLEDREARLTALQRAITEGLASGIAEDFSFEALQKELDDA